MVQSGRLSNAIARCVIDRFAGLPENCKPRRQSAASGLRQSEWVPLAGIVAEAPEIYGSSLRCVSLATGMKCSPQESLLHTNGIRLHDSHAEVLAIRSFNRTLLDQCFRLCSDSGPPNSAPLLVERAPPSQYATSPFRIRDGVRLHMYCSECPCGDASMELVMSRQDDSTPWVREPSDSAAAPEQLLGRGQFDRLGIVRRKPARPDAPVTMSKSCSDKLALRQTISLLSGLTSLFVSPDNAYLQSLVLPDSDFFPAALERAFGSSGRLAPLVGWKHQGGFAFRPFQIGVASEIFLYSRQTIGEEGKASNLACIATENKVEVLVNGVLQGRKQTDRRGASSISRLGMWSIARQLALEGSSRELEVCLDQPSYEQVKSHPLLMPREAAKTAVLGECLSPWPRNTADRSWSLTE